MQQIRISLIQIPWQIFPFSHLEFLQRWTPTVQGHVPEAKYKERCDSHKGSQG